MLQTFELLDRFEILYPEITELSDIRRAYIDEDLSSIFRLANKFSTELDIEDLRKAVLEQNLHSIFRLIDSEDLRKLVMEDNTWSLWKLLSKYTDTQFVPAFKNFFINNTNYDKDCFSRGQLQSKLWLVNEVKKLNIELGTVFLCAGWYGTLATMLFESGIKVDKIRSFDIDETTVNIAEVFNKPWFVDQWRYKSLVQDIMDIDYKEHVWQFWSNANNRMSRPITDVPDTIINTSCEHIEKFTDWYNKIPQGKIIIIQANDYHEVEEHVNTYNTLEEFSANAPMTKVLYEGELELQKYKRFMKIGCR